MSLDYNAQNAVSKETNALGHSTAYHYNADGELIEIVKANEAVISYDNNEETQTSVVKINNANQFTTKKDSLITTVTNHTLNDQTVTYTKSENGLLQRVDFSAPKNNAITYTYKNEEALEKIQYGTNTITYSPDTNGQIESVSLNGETIASFISNANGLRTSTTLGNNASITNKYIGNETLLEKQIFNTNSKTNTHTYDYDANKQIEKITSNAGTVTYEYDALNQLKQEQYSSGLTISYTYDDVGNRKSKTITQNGVTTTTDYGYNDANQMTAAGSQSIAVDVNGNVTNDGRYEYVWNAFDQLTEVKSLTGSNIATYKYDENGRRVYSNDSNGETYYRYNGSTNQVLFEENTSGDIIKAYTYDDNGYPLTMTYEGETYYYLTNYRGDVLALTNTNGAVVAEYTYDAWGNILSQSGTMAAMNPYRYASYRYDEQTKLYYLMARYYNPDTGVLLSLDAYRGDKEIPITMNGYNYANNNPIIFVDTDGNNPVLIKLLQITVIPILKYLAKRYGPKLMKELNYIVSSNINRYIKKYAKDYNIYFGQGNLVSIVKKSGKGDRRIFSFEYAKVTFMNGKKQVQENAWHYHLGDPKLHYVFRWNDQYRKGYTFGIPKTHWWVW